MPLRELLVLLCIDLGCWFWVVLFMFGVLSLRNTLLWVLESVGLRWVRWVVWLVDVGFSWVWGLYVWLYIVIFCYFGFAIQVYSVCCLEFGFMGVAG